MPGMKACQYFEVKVGWYGNIPDKSELTQAAKHYTWRGFRQSRGIRSKTKRVFTQFSPHDFTAFHWHGTASLLHYVTVVVLLAVFLAAELNPFYLKVFVISPPLISRCDKPNSVSESPLDGARSPICDRQAGGCVPLRSPCRS